jgi:hypothetical protein
MRTRSITSLLAVGVALATLAAPRAEAQVRTPVTVCRDGSHIYSNDASVCSQHRGIDVRATETARRREWDRNQNARDDRDNRDGRYDNRDGRYDNRDGRYDNRDGRYDNRDGRYDNRRDNDPRYGNDRWGYGRDGRAMRGQVYEWSGRVDKEVRIQLRGDRAFVQSANAADGKFSRSRVTHELPRRDGRLVVARLDGRGIVDVLSQPTARNGYTATLRVRDPNGGADDYHIVAYWEPYDSQYGYGRSDGY